MMKQIFFNVCVILMLIFLFVTVAYQDAAITAQDKTIVSLEASQKEQADTIKHLADNSLLTAKTIKAITDTQESQGRLNVTMVKAIMNR